MQGAALHLPGKLLKKVSLDPSKPFIFLQNFLLKSPYARLLSPVSLGRDKEMGTRNKR